MTFRTRSVSCCSIGDKGGHTQVISVSWWWGQHDDDRDTPVLKEAHERSIERFIARPESGNRQYTFSPQFLNQSPLAEDDGKHVSESRERDKDVKGTLCLGSKNIAEKGTGQDASAADDFRLWDSGEIGDVGQHVEDADDYYRGRGCDFEGADGVFHLGHGVVCIAVADVGPDDIVEGGDDAVRGASGSLEGVGEVVRFFVEADMACEGCEASTDDQEEDEQFDHAQGVLQTQAPV